MELRVPSYCLCFLCALCAYPALSQDVVVWKAQPPVDSRYTNNIVDKNVDSVAIEGTRDKRALGLILSGLAQVFGYTVTPVQLATLPNPSRNTTAAASAPPAQMKPSSMTASSNNSTKAPASRQRETIKLTGIVNLGNGTNLLDHLQQYERIFHGTPPPASPSPPPAAPSVDPRLTLDTKPPLLSPLLVKIPLPIAPNLPPPLPSFSTRYMPICKQQESIYRQKENKDEYVVQDKEIYDEKDVKIPAIEYDRNTYLEEPYRKLVDEEEYVVVDKEIYDAKDVKMPVNEYTYIEEPYRKQVSKEKYIVENKEIFDERDVNMPVHKYSQQIAEPYWKKQHEDRIAELERKQAEQAQRFEEREQYRERVKDKEYTDEKSGEEYREEERDGDDREADSAYKDRDEDREESNRTSDDESKTQDEDSTEKYIQNESTEEFQKTDEEEEDAVKYRDYEGDDSSKSYKDGKQVSPKDHESYSGLKVEQQLPIGDYYDRRKPEQIRNSYGEILDERAVGDADIVSFYSAPKNPESAIYDSSSRDTGDELKVTEGYLAETDGGNLEENIERLRQEYGVPLAENKYEEYEVEDDERGERKSTKNIQQFADKNRPVEVVQDFHEVPHVSRPDKNQIRAQEELHRGIDFIANAPYLVPLRYLYAPDELQKAKSLNHENLDKNEESYSGALQRKPEERRSREEALKPKIGPPQKPSLEKLHEGEKKVFQAWPPPFDYVFDSTERTNVLLPNGAQNHKNHGNSNERQNQEKNHDLGRKGYPGEFRNEKHIVDGNGKFQNVPPIKKPNTNINPLHVSSPNHSQSPNASPHKNLRFYPDERDAPDITDPYSYITRDYNGNPMNVEIRNHGRDKYDRSNGVYSQTHLPLRGTTDQHQEYAYVQDSQPLNQAAYNDVQIMHQYYAQADPHGMTGLQIGSQSEDMSSHRFHPHVALPITTFEAPPREHKISDRKENRYNVQADKGTKKSEIIENVTGSVFDTETHGLLPPDPPAYVYNKKLGKSIDDSRNKREDRFKEYREKVATVKIMKEQINGPFTFVEYH
ncbi:hypothetical protein KM043_007973 [Ampulex compressa]|nr:hypothetical protein KM043_007973 [Ampulex compressa]